MADYRITLGDADRVRILYSYQNAPNGTMSLKETVLHWFNKTLQCDGLDAKGATASVDIQDAKPRPIYTLLLNGPKAIADDLALYTKRLPQFLDNGWNAWNDVVPVLKDKGLWDPSPDEPLATYRPWRFFLPLGMAMVKQHSLQFFHYPPIRLLEGTQDYLMDPVPKRCIELLLENGVPQSDVLLFNTVMDAAPIAAADDQGSKKGGDKKWGLIPINYFHDYQKAQVKLLLNTSPNNRRYTIPIVVYGAHPRDTFNDLYNTKLDLKASPTTVAQIIPGKKTPVLCSSHPYVFYATAQGFSTVGSGKFLSRFKCMDSISVMRNDLIVTRWQKIMADDPALDPQEVFQDCTKYWKDPSRDPAVCALVRHQGSLYYASPTSLDFEFQVSRKQADGYCKANDNCPCGDVIGRPADTSTQPNSAPAKAAAPAASRSAKKKTPLVVIGDSGKPVDWWFVYKISKESQTTSGKPITGGEYAYFDSDMAGKRGAKLVLSDNHIEQNGALHDTLAPLFDPATNANTQIGWFCYNDESRFDSRGAGTGPSDRGHCKGVLAFDLETDSAFWLIHSVPLFPLKAEFNYPATGHKMAQTMLCIQLADADTAKQIAQLMYDAHGPNVNVVSSIPQALAAKDPRTLLMHDLNGSMHNPKPNHGRVPFLSRAGEKFLAIAKNKAWGNPQIDPEGARDFYNDLVAPALDEDIEVETWENAGNKIPKEVEHGEKHRVENMQAVDLNQVGIPYAWSEKFDHAKLALSDRTNPPGTDRWVCVGDINYTLAQERRGGGTVAFKCPSLWNNLVKVLSDKDMPAPKAAARPRKQTPAPRKRRSAKPKRPRANRATRRRPTRRRAAAVRR